MRLSGKWFEKSEATSDSNVAFIGYVNRMSRLTLESITKKSNIRTKGSKRHCFQSIQWYYRIISWIKPVETFRQVLFVYSSNGNPEHWQIYLLVSFGLWTGCRFCTDGHSHCPEELLQIAGGEHNEVQSDPKVVGRQFLFVPRTLVFNWPGRPKTRNVYVLSPWQSRNKDSRLYRLSNDSRYIDIHKYEQY